MLKHRAALLLRAAAWSQQVQQQHAVSVLLLAASWSSNLYVPALPSAAFLQLVCIVGERCAFVRLVQGGIKHCMNGPVSSGLHVHMFCYTLNRMLREKGWWEGVDGNAHKPVLPASLLAHAPMRPIIIIMLPNQAIASTPSAPHPSGAEGRGSTAPLCLQLLRTSQACFFWLQGEA
jgi:hypothetical protein